MKLLSGIFEQNKANFGALCVEKIQLGYIKKTSKNKIK